MAMHAFALALGPWLLLRAFACESVAGMRFFWGGGT